jgi:hypothetical protein
MSVALIEYKVRILPPDGDVTNGTMDHALDAVTGKSGVLRSVLEAIHNEVESYLRVTGLKGFTVTVEEISE